MFTVLQQLRARKMHSARRMPVRFRISNEQERCLRASMRPRLRKATRLLLLAEHVHLQFWLPDCQPCTYCISSRDINHMYRIIIGYRFYVSTSARFLEKNLTTNLNKREK